MAAEDFRKDGEKIGIRACSTKNMDLTETHMEGNTSSTLT